MKPYPTRYIPPGSTKWESGNCIAYLWHDGKYPAAIGYYNRRNKPDFNYRFTNDEGRSSFLKSWAEQKGKADEEKEAVRMARKNFLHDFKIGDILHGSTGYDMVINHFYQVVGFTLKTITIQAIDSTQIPTSQGAGVETPRRDCFKKGSKPHRVTVRMGIAGHDEGITSIRRNADTDKTGSMIVLTKFTGIQVGYDELD